MRGHAPLALLIACAAGSLAGCGSKTSRPMQDGILWVSWTVRGQPVSNRSCTGIDHMSLTMDTASGALTIEPIPCLRGLGWEYDGLPEGNNFVIIDAYDTRGLITLEGASTVAVAATRAAMPAPIDL
ncbi:MAG: hypothetical protein ACXVCV_13075, partial [Polyangia bacterium]